MTPLFSVSMAFRNHDVCYTQLYTSLMGWSHTHLTPRTSHSHLTPSHLTHTHTLPPHTHTPTSHTPLPTSHCRFVTLQFPGSASRTAPQRPTAAASAGCEVDRLPAAGCRSRHDSHTHHWQIQKNKVSITNYVGMNI